MIDLKAQEIKFGSGDVGARLSITGELDAPIGKIVFFNQSPRDIKCVEPEEKTTSVRMQSFLRSEMFMLSFSNAESVDAVISILERLKEETFGDDDSFRNKFINGN